MHGSVRGAVRKNCPYRDQLRRKVGSGSWSTVRKVEYDYYTSGESGGNLGDLRRATVTDASSNVLDQNYYRYYKTNTSTSYQGGMKYALDTDAYARLKAAAGGTDADVVIASDATVADYADSYFEYDSNKRVTKHETGAGGATGTSTYAYTQSTNAVGYNSWAMRTVETLPEGHTNTVYTNAFGEVMLSAYKESGSTDEWITYHYYEDDSTSGANDGGRLLLTANPSAVTGYDDTYADLVNYVSSNAQYLSDSTGLYQVFDYYSSTTATDTVAGGVEDYQESTAIRQGETGTNVPQQAWSYFYRTGGNGIATPIAEQTQYRNDNGTGAQTTSYAYTWFTGTAQAESVTITLPTVTTAQNGPNTASTMTTYFDSYGRAIWSKDAEGYLNYTEYDTVTGGVVKSIVDVDTTQTSTFSNLPSGWSTPSGGGLHLTSTAEVDFLGRTTKSTDPEGKVDYTVYLDDDFEVRSYPAWDTTTNTPTGPTTVYRQDRDYGYTETLTMSATPTVASGKPTGAEAISNIESLSRSYTNEAGQVTHSDSYFDLTSVSYTTSTTFGVEGTNYYRTQQGYDDQGRPSRSVTAAGTITRMVYDGQDRLLSTWVGTDDTPTTGEWSPTNTTGTNLCRSVKPNTTMAVLAMATSPR